MNELSVGDFVTHKTTNRCGIVAGLEPLETNVELFTESRLIWFEKDLGGKCPIGPEGYRIIEVPRLIYVRSASVEDKEILLTHPSSNIRKFAITL